MRNAPAEEARRWLTEARHDLEAARLLAGAGKHHLACFHAQQAAEKALKGFLYGKGEEAVVGHSVHQLRLRAQPYASQVEALPDVRMLDAYYLAPRYPNGLPFDTLPSESFGPEQSTAAIDVASVVLLCVEKLLPR